MWHNGILGKQHYELVTSFRSLIFKVFFCSWKDFGVYLSVLFFRAIMCTVSENQSGQHSSPYSKMTWRHIRTPRHTSGKHFGKWTWRTIVVIAYTRTESGKSEIACNQHLLLHWKGEGKRLSFLLLIHDAFPTWAKWLIDSFVIQSFWNME